MAAHKLSSSFLLLALSMLPHTAQGLSPTTLTLAVSSNPSTFGAPVTLTATVTPSNATGQVTFYDGVTILGTKPLSGGSAAFLTRLLPSGARKLRAYYAGDSSNAAATSNVVAQAVNAFGRHLFGVGAYALGIDPNRSRRFQWRWDCRSCHFESRFDGDSARQGGCEFSSHDRQSVESSAFLWR